MSELEDKLQQLLSDPAGMAQVMQLAKELSGSMPSAPPQEAKQSAAPPLPELGSLDPKLLARFLPMLQAFTRGDSNAANLLHALRPYLKEEKQAKIERAVHLARLITIGKKFLAEEGLRNV